MPYIPHTESDITEMLATIGITRLDDVFSEIPESLRSPGLNNIPAGWTEAELLRETQARLAKDRLGSCFLGAGAYEHHIPAAVWDIAGRGEFLTAYTPYQAEASQGTLQLLYEFQTEMASLMGLDVSNASLYDGASALAEAILMALRCAPGSKSAKKAANPRKILIPRAVHPAYRATARTILSLQHFELIELPYDPKTGRVDEGALAQHDGEVAALVLAQPNFFGVLEEVDRLTDWAHQQGALVIASVNPIATALLKEPGQWGQTGADIACGEGQPLGIPLASGGPYFGFMCCKTQFVRQMPGRIIGRTVDVEGKPGYALTLQAREQHIRRSKATSNICTNQGLMVTAATIYMSLLGPEGLRRVAAHSHSGAGTLKNKLSSVEGIQFAFDSPYFHEWVIRCKRPVADVCQAMAEQGIQAGYPLGNDYPELADALLVCVTDTKTEGDLEAYYGCLAKVLQQ